MTDGREVLNRSRPFPGRRAIGAVAGCIALAGSLLLVPRVAEAGDSNLAIPNEVLLDARDGSAEVIIQLVPEAASEGDELMEQIGEPGADVLPALGVVTADLNVSQLKELSDSGIVARIEQDVYLSPQLDKSTVKIGARTAWAAGQTGIGRTIAIIDSGVDSNHPALVGKVVLEACFTRDSCPNGQASMTGPGAAQPCAVNPTCEHGTHVAGIAAGRHSTYSGVAPDAGILAIQVFSLTSAPADCPGRAVPCTRARTSDVLAGLDYLATMPAWVNLVAVNLSLSSDSVLANCDSSILASAVNKLKGLGVATVAASGNGGFATGLGVPACISSTVSVGASYADRDVLWAQSNFSTTLDLLAPGVGIVSPALGGGFSATTGTSAAAPHVTGAWAVASQRLGTNNVDRILTYLRHTGAPIANPAFGGAAKPRIELSGMAGPLQPASYVTNPLSDKQCRNEQFTSWYGRYSVWACVDVNGIQHWSAMRNNVDVVVDIWSWPDVKIATTASPQYGPGERQMLICQNRTAVTTVAAPSPFEGRWQRFNSFDSNGGFNANVGVDNLFTITSVAPEGQASCVIQRLF